MKMLIVITASNANTMGGANEAASATTMIAARMPSAAATTSPREITERRAASPREIRAIWRAMTYGSAVPPEDPTTTRMADELETIENDVRGMSQTRASE